MVFDFDAKASLIVSHQVQESMLMLLFIVFMLSLYKFTYRWIQSAAMLIFFDAVYLCLILTVRLD